MTKRFSLSCLLICFAFLLIGCSSFSKSSADPIEQLEKSILCEDGAISFQLPSDFSGECSILIYGRTEDPEAGGMSAHYLQDETWSAGQRYSFTPEGNHSELGMSVSYKDSRQSCEKDIDLLPLL